MSETKQAVISPGTLVNASMVVTMLAAAVSFGIMYQKIEGVREQVSSMNVKMTKMDDKLDRLAESKLTVSLSPD